MSNFNDENFDGVSLQLPNWFIKLNKLEGLLETISDELKRCEFSTHLPLHNKNLYELENYEDKGEQLKFNEEEAKRRKEQRENEFNLVLTNQKKLLHWDKRKEVLDSDADINVDELKFSFDDIFTDKLSIKTSFVKAFKEHINTFEKFKKFCLIECKYIHGLLENCNEEDVDWRNVRFSVFSGYPSLQMNINFTTIDEKIQPSKVGYTYQRELLKCKDGVYYSEHTKNTYEGYTRKGMTLTKN